MNLLENVNELNKKIKENFNLEDMQNNFLKSDIGQIANTVLDAGLKVLLPDYMENEVIEVKNAFMYEGVQEGINSAVENAINVGKKILGLENSDFKTVGQAKEALEKGNLIKNISNNINSTINKISGSNISNNVTGVLNENRENITNNIKNNLKKEIDNEFLKQEKSIEKIQKYINKWEESYFNKDIDGLNKQYNKIEKEFNNILPLENVINNIHKIQNINELIKNTENFDFNLMYLELAEKI